jgi:microcystin-dependent protein
MSLTINGSTGSIIGTLPAGMVMYFANSTAPQGWFQCNGATISRTTYVDLFNAIGTTYGAGDGATTFSIPDLRGQFIRAWSSATSVAATFNGTINSGSPFVAGTVLTVTSPPTGKLLIGQTLTGANVTANTKIIAQVNGTAGGVGEYTVSLASTISATTLITATVPDAGRFIGSNQVDAYPAHIHGVSIGGSGNIQAFPANSVMGSNSSNSNLQNFTASQGSGTETRPLNAALMICIKY